MASLRAALFWVIERSLWWQIYALTAAVIIVGVALDLAFCSNWLQRLSALCAASIAIVAFFDPRQRDNWVGERKKALEVYDKSFRESPPPGAALAQMAMRMGGGDKAGRERLAEVVTLEKKRHLEKRRALLNRYQRERTNADRSVTAQQICILVTTLLGIFGDLLMPVLRFGQSTC